MHKIAAFVLACAAGGASAQPWDSDSGVPDLEWRGGAQLKRDWTSRGTPQETTKTTVEINTFIDSPVSFIRLTVPFPDEDTDFGGSPLDPQLGDISVRAGFRALKHGKLSFPSYVALTFPTANPQSAGSQNYEIAAGIKMLAPLEASFLSDAHRTRFEAELSQTNSFAGEPDAKDTNATKLEFTLSDLWRERYAAKASYKPTWDHVKHETGAVVEVQVGFYFGEREGRTHHPWRIWVMGGGRVSGPEGVSGTYNTRLELGVARTF